MMTRSEELIARYLDDSLTEEEHVELITWLESDAGNLRVFVAAVARDEQLRGLVQSMQPDTPVATVQPARQVGGDRRRRSPRITRLLLVSLVVAVGWLILPNENSASPITYEGGGEMVSLQTLEGPASQLNAGQTFTTGTLLVGGQGTRANFTYADGSKVRVAGGTELKFEIGDGKRLVLHRGTLAAEVSEQADRLPLLLRTPTAEATAQGVSFVVDAHDEDTLLRVNKGTVHIRRMADNQSVLVAQNQQVHAEQLAERPLQSEPVQPVLASWKASSKAAGNVEWIGEWSKDEVLKAKGREVFLKSLRVNETHFHAGAHNDFPGLFSLKADSVVRIRFRITRPLNVGVFLSTHSPSWNFTGNFQAYIEYDKSPPDEEGWQTATIPIGTFQPLRKNGPAFQPGCVAATIFATTYGDDVGLEVSQLEVVSATAKKS